MNVLLFNLVMAVAIAVIITAISIIKNPILKTIVYSLPIPITLALIATQQGVEGSHIFGLFLLVGFLWLVHWLRKARVNVFVADIISALIYVVLGYVFVQMDSWGRDLFILLSIMYPLFWAGYMLLRRNRNEDMPATADKVSVATKGFLVFVIASLLLTMKDLLKGVVVTFPFSGVFAVIEMRGKLHTLAAEFTKNSIAIWAFFMIVYIAMPTFSIYTAIVLGWTGYLVTLKMVHMTK